MAATPTGAIRSADEEIFRPFSGDCKESTPASRSRFVLGMRVDGTSYAEATDLIVSWAQREQSRCVIEVPVNAVMECYDHPDFQRIINSADLVTPGGMPVVWTLRLLGLQGQPRVYGPELTLRVCEAAARRRIPVGFYGGSEQALALLRQRLGERYPGLWITYACSPPFRALSPEEEGKVADDIRRSGCRILFVGLGCPKQERWMARHHGAIPAVMLGVGAAFDFISGQKKQAPAWLMALGLEWLFRWMTEPRRLFYRYAYHNPRFVALITWQLLRERCFAPVFKRFLPANASDTREEAQVTSCDPKISRSETDAESLQKLLRQKRGQLMFKRLLDITGALFGLVLMGFPLLVIALLVRLGSPGPVIFSQARVGRRGKHFVMYKFRTMQAQRDAAADEAQAAAAKAGILVKGKDDSRVTGIGRFLRSTSLDELPQLFNVLKGDMSFVGPRPLIPFMLAGHPEFAEARALMRPGITGLWQVHERENNTSAQVMMPYDLEYIRRFSLGRDLGILLRTPFVVFAGNGAV